MARPAGSKCLPAPSSGEARGSFGRLADWDKITIAKYVDRLSEVAGGPIKEIPGLNPVGIKGKEGWSAKFFYIDSDIPATPKRFAWARRVKDEKTQLEVYLSKGLYERLY